VAELSSTQRHLRAGEGTNFGRDPGGGRQSGTEATAAEASTHTHTHTAQPFPPPLSCSG
jgi:hypothetical protein